ncbi:OmpA family protein [Hymenobacter properus]|uniref:OmpA family protein n=1 Tax=Hymenobacter properus TaxID=2791026 RepID=A0A931BIX9_9BACT|nr:OmpA family protein [Hymenobacter properus]MBF9142361.1 OmpA family protein [Hymenobacter properus]MBR7721168.1 OmpA family protein [Microvirga sp. SRT04]
MQFLRIPLLALVLSALACSSRKDTTTEMAHEAPAATVAAVPAKPAEPTAPAPAPAAPVDTAHAPADPAGFDPASAPVANPKLGAWPYFSLLEGYHKGTIKDPEISHDKFNDLFKDVAFDRYEFFDGVKLIPVEGRLTTFEAIGKGASFFQVQKTYEKLVHDLGGVTVWEGPMEKFKDTKLKMDEERHRGQYSMWTSEKAGVYMVRTSDREIWVEVYQRYNDPAGYWLTVAEKKALPMQASVLPAAEMKKALDATGHVALYLNFDTDQATLKPDAQATIAQIISLLSQNPDLKLSVEGHTDNAGTAPHNQQLSEARARTVVATLTAQGIAADRLKAAGFGQTKPLSDNATDAGKARNRRVELVKM